MHDVLDIIKNVQSLYSVGPTLGILKDFERVVDELDVYVFTNWAEVELLSGPVDSRHFVTSPLVYHGGAGHGGADGIRNHFTL